MPEHPIRERLYLSQVFTFNDRVFCHAPSDFLRHECKFFIQTSDMHLVNSFMNLYTCLLDEIAAQENAEGADRMSTSQVCASSHDHQLVVSVVMIKPQLKPSLQLVVSVVMIKPQFKHSLLDHRRSGWLITVDSEELLSIETVVGENLSFCL